MVEGPGCKLKGEKIKSKLMNQTVKSVSGNAVDREKKPKKGITESQFDVLVGQTLTKVQTLGKELFMYFGDICLRVHFLMAGSFRVNGQALDKDYGKLTETPSLQVDFSTDVLTFYKSAVQIRESESCSTRYNDLHDLDICSPVFNHQRAVTLVMEQCDRQVCDVLLDQTILPGVGNIIKNEALFDSGIKPSSKVQELSKELISHLVKMTRDFSLIFYKCRKTGTNLNQYMKIYNRRKCCQCEGKVTITRAGEDSERMTHYCPNCQTNTLKSAVKSHPCKNSLLGWVKTANQKVEVQSTNLKQEDEWTCQVCTLINKGTHLSCEACQAERKAKSPGTVTDLKRKLSTDSNEHTTKRLKSEDTCRTNNLSNKNVLNHGQYQESNMSQASRKAIEKEGLVPYPHVEPVASQKLKPRYGSNKMVHQQNVKKSNSINLMNSKTTDSKVSVQQKPSSQPVRLGTSKIPAGQSTSKIPLCPGHSKPCSMTQTRKKGDNFLRWFFSCGVYPRTKQCKFFKWADESFPICPTHGKPAAFRTVLKEGPNNGKKFFACPLPKQKQCGFFEWAEGF